MQVNNKRQIQPYFTLIEMLELITGLDIEETTTLHELILLEEDNYTTEEMDKIWCALIDRYVRLEMLDSFSLS